MTEIPQERIKEFWEKCGFIHGSWQGWFEPKDLGEYCDDLPLINLDNLFKYAVSNVMGSNQNFIDIQVRRYIAPGYDDFLISYTCEIWSDNGQGSIIKQANTPALALFWAIWEVIKSETET